MMLTCRDLSLQADAFLDGELGLWKRLRIRLHLSMCKGCSRFLDQMRTTRSLVKAEGEIADGGENARIDSILDALHKEKQSGGLDGTATFVKDQGNDKSQ